MIPKKQILVIEDNEINREILKEIHSETYQVLEAENGQEGLEILKKYKNSISLILLDVMMPVMDGLNKRRGSPAEKDSPSYYRWYGKGSALRSSRC